MGREGLRTAALDQSLGAHSLPMPLWTLTKGGEPK
jgi:hypothetical protein